MSPSEPRGFVIGIVGAESTGKSVLAEAITARLGAEGLTVAHVGEALREFCDRLGRTPRRDEQAAIADLQTARIEAAARSHALVVADTTALMTAVYSDIVFGDTGLYPVAEQAHRRCDLTLLTALDLPWVADGLQRDGPQVRVPVDRRVRAALQRAGVGHALIAGTGDARTEAAMAAVRHALEGRPVGVASPLNSAPSTPAPGRPAA
jgi:nicotinamide riboside kinase